jgi:hypothetical protein
MHNRSWQNITVDPQHFGQRDYYSTYLKTLKSGTFNKTKMKAKAIARASTLDSIPGGGGAMSQPQCASVNALSKSATDDKTSQLLECGNNQIRPHARMA